MPSISSPILYPQSSSPPPAKRTRQDESSGVRKPKPKMGFVLEEDSEDEGVDLAVQEPSNKKRMLEDPREKSPVLQSVQTFSDSAVDLTHANSEEEDEEEDADSLPSLRVPEQTVAESQQSTALPSLIFGKGARTETKEVVDCRGQKLSITSRSKTEILSYEHMVAARSTTKAGRAKKAYYGIDIQQLISDATKEIEASEKKTREEIPEVMPSIEQAANQKAKRSLMWTEKYRARNFMELVGDDRTHRQVLRWLKAWDPLVFPKTGKAKPAAAKGHPGAQDEKIHKKILMLTGPPGLGKTTLAHVCARQAGYEVMEINASDERSKDVVEGRIRTSVGTESVKTGATITSKTGNVQKVAHPLCVVVDEVDGVVGGSGGSGEGGFVKALINLITIDQKNSAPTGTTSNTTRKKRKGDDFKLMRPLILICNDVYHPSLKPLRQSNLAEIIHVRKPPFDAVVTRMKGVFEKEGVSCDGDAVRRLCEATWGVSAAEAKRGREGTGEGDLRGIMVVGEWAASKLKTSCKAGITPKLTRKWVEQHMMSSLSHDGGSARGVGRGGSKEIVNRVFLEGAGFPKSSAAIPVPGKHADEQPKTQLGVAELAKRAGMDRLRAMVDTSGEIDRIVTEIFSDYPNQPFNDDNILSKPDEAYEWLAFHDKCSNRVYSAQEYELAPYLSQPILACHNLFASPARHHFNNKDEGKKWGEEEQEPLPFTGPRADYSAFETEKVNRATIVSLQSSLSTSLQRNFRSPEDIATDLLPYLVRILTPEVKPIVVGGSGEQKGIASVRSEVEKVMVKRAVNVMSDVGVVYQRGKLEGDFGARQTQWVYRMEP